MAREGASAAMLLRFKKEIIEAARKADKDIINVMANESWVELKILVPYERYRHPEGLSDLREQIEAENEGVVVPPLSMRWMRAKRVIEEHFQRGGLPLNTASVVFKVPNKVAGQKLLSEMWVAGNRFKALPFIPDKADTLCSRCSAWGHSEFRCQKQGGPVCSICAGSHRTEGHKCEVATCGATGRVCPHATLKCPNCGGNHPAKDARCKAKGDAVAIARGGRVPWAAATQRMQEQTGDSGTSQMRLQRPQTLAPARQVADWTENRDEMEIATEMETSGTAPPIAE
jgi:hypothetical protein